MVVTKIKCELEGKTNVNFGHLSELIFPQQPQKKKVT